MEAALCIRSKGLSVYIAIHGKILTQGKSMFNYLPGVQIADQKSTV